MRGRNDWGAKIIALLTGTAMLWTLAACGQQQPEPTPSTSTSQSSTDVGQAAILLPNDGITLSQSTPLNKWTKLSSALETALDNDGFDDKDVTTVKSKTLEDQTKAVTDYIDGHDDSRPATIIIAPVAQPDDITRQYGDYVAQALTTTADDTDQDSTAKTQAADLAEALTKAHDTGIHVILVSNTLDGYTPDAYVNMSTIREIAHTQATLLADKLVLSKATKDNPKNIEILLPSNGDDNADREAFAGIWEVLGPYFASGAATSPSGLLNTTSDENSWNQVTFTGTDKDSAKAALASRLKADDANVHLPIDGVLAMNDLVASGATSALADLGYEGTAADINPKITIGGIVDNIAGNKDLKKDKVPEPQKVAPEAEENPDTDSADSSEGQQSAVVDDPAWPIVTGYGAYPSNLSAVVNGQQWSTGLERRDDYATSIATASAALNAGRKLSSVKALSLSGTTEMNGAQVPTIHLSLQNVSASNLKSALIDAGYVSAADAGL
ncbi:substrate-binding domain-containing protein [Bifidobacterium vansinderenii]|uniref:Xylose ABC transporter n=1 Tax=Bifidobacterium vansinderenii TaxID=1984871 RepID=A0A229VV57_9BIFI|nr:substrate-binding domain-containing protein [Bifidobacterium vansinderenii]OXM99299.1 xylose ABC transporter [Bifidobacterium vansinderenii]